LRLLVVLAWLAHVLMLLAGTTLPKVSAVRATHSMMGSGRAAAGQSLGGAARGA
jgi:hypothetical protein